jgi:hypothetical protein
MVSSRVVWWIIAAPIFVGAVFFIVGLAFWTSYPHESWRTCIYTDKDCSLAVGTWFLADVTLAAFLAAGVAAFFAANAYSLETKAVLGHRLCPLKEHRREPDATLYVTSLKASPRRFPPVDKGPGFYTEQHAFLNLGRVPLTDVSVKYTLKVEGRDDPFRGDLGLDCIMVDGEAHVTLFVRKDIPGVKITWRKAKQGDVDLTFFPGKAYTAAATDIPRSRRSRRHVPHAPPAV